MMSTAPAAVPYERQSAAPPNRDCGAACLAMVYRSLGREVPQEEIWPAIAKANRFGSIASTTHLMAKDALSRGFAALAFQPRDPLLALRRSRDLGIRAILNHRLHSDVPAGHYTVLVDIDEQRVVLHDPFYGPNRQLSRDEMLELWEPRFPDSEIVGCMLIAVAAGPLAMQVCELCRTPLPASVACPNCNDPLSLQPAVLLGCINPTCVARAWNYVCCPSCDSLWTFSAATPPPAAEVAADREHARPNAPPPPEALDFTGTFAELDKFCALVLSVPAAAHHPDIQRYMQALAGCKEDLKKAQVEALKNLKLHQDQMAKMVQEATRKQEAHRKRMEDLNRPSPPLDANTLAHALLKNLGYVG